LQSIYFKLNYVSKKYCTKNYDFYIAGIFVTVGLSLIVLSDIWLIKQKIELEGNISNLFETIQEIRRTEKNFFLYKNEVDYNDNLSYIKTVKNFIKNQKFEGLKIGNAIQELSDTLRNYEALMLQLKEKYNFSICYLS